MPSAFVYLGMSWFLSHFQRTLLPATGFFINRIFSFISLNISAHCLLASKVSDEKSTHNFIENPLCVMVCFSRAAFKIHSLFLAFECMIIMCLGWIPLSSPYLELVCWAFRMFIFMSLIQLEKCSTVISSNILSASLYSPSSPLGLPHCASWST